MTDHETLRSADDTVDLHLHHFAEPPSPAATVLLSHATGFHSHCYLPIARALGDRFRVVAIDHRGHGLTEAAPGWDVDWAKFGDDAGTVAEHLFERHGDAIVGFGHSMGGAALLLAAAARPELFRSLVLFEPIGFPPTEGGQHDNPLAAGARRRRFEFDSYDAAVHNYSERPPLAWFLPEVLRLYVEHGFRPTGSGVELRCHREFEAATFEAAVDNGVWDAAADVKVPTVLIGGIVEDDQPSRIVAPMAEHMPNATMISLPHQTHFGPMTHPDEIAGLIANAALA